MGTLTITPTEWKSYNSKTEAEVSNTNACSFVYASNTNYYAVNNRIKITPGVRLRKLTATINFQANTLASRAFYLRLATSASTSPPSGTLGTIYSGNTSGNNTSGTKTLTMDVDMEAGHDYYLWITTGASGSAGRLTHNQNITITGETEIGAARIWAHHMTPGESATQSISVNDTYRAGGSLAADGFNTLREIGLTGTNYVGSGIDGNGYNTTMIPVSAVDFSASAIILTMTVYKSPSGVDTFRWAITTSRDKESEYEGWAEVTSTQDENQLAGGTFTPSGSAGSTSTQTFTFPASIPANTPVYIYLHGSSGSYGNIHITGTIGVLLFADSEIVLEWVETEPYSYNGESWDLYSPNIKNTNDWETAS